MNTATRGTRRANTQRRQPVSISGPSPLPSQRRRRSRSPDAQPAQEQRQLNFTRKPDASHADQTKRKKPGNPSLSSSTSRSFLVAVDDTNSDRGRKGKVKPRPHNRHLAENAPHASTSRAPEVQAKRERSKSRESIKLPSKGTASDAEGSGRDTQGIMDAHADYTGPLAAAEYAKIKRELDSWKKLAHENKKTMKKQTKVIEELRQQDNTLRQRLKESESQISKLHSKTKKSDEVITTVESNSQCQICMELLYRPYALSPCGHILCVTCLQEWFRKAPAVDDDMYDDTDPDYLLRRRKTCPCCRAHVRHRPIPVFMIKAIVAAIAKVKAPQTGASLGRDLASNDSDPWEGLFPDDDEEIDDFGATDGEDEDEDEDIDEEDEEDSSWYDEVFSYGTGSEDETYAGAYLYPQWEPPSVVIDEDDYLFDQLDESDLHCLRRGVTIGMLQECEVEYKHDQGLVARDEAYNRIFLGWNIRLSADDDNGEIYMQYIADDMIGRPERWNIIEDDDGGFEAHLLVPEEEVCEYDDTDSDNYMEVDDLD
ncbi:hypothetical protein OG21DRAFT_1510954 [Imleria badia]|nr:hypothetical protein OG21DRAFT_1510954 [Imleria badia]